VAERWLSSSRILNITASAKIRSCRRQAFTTAFGEASPQYNQRKCPIMKIFEPPGGGFPATCSYVFFLDLNHQIIV
jgi:hypothetical protein